MEYRRLGESNRCRVGVSDRRAQGRFYFTRGLTTEADYEAPGGGVGR